MAAVFVKCTKLVGAINSNAASATVSATAGNLLVAIASVYYPGTATTPTLTVTGGGTWTLDSRDNQHFTSSNDNFCNGFAHVAAATGGSATFTVTWGVTATGAVAIGYIYEFSGAPGTFDAAGTGIQNTASPVLSPTFTNPTASDIMLAVGATYSAGTESHGSPANSWTMPTNGDETNGNSFLTGVTAYKIVSASAAQSTSWTVSPSVASVTHIAAYKAATTTTYNVTVSATQAQSLALATRLVLARSVSATQPQSVALTRQVPASRTVSATQAQACSLSVVLQRRYTLNTLASQAQAATVSATVSRTHLPVDFYTTTFPLTENPILEGGVWTLGRLDALDWTNPRTTTNKAFGTQSGVDNPPYTDSIAVMRGTWGADQEVMATVFSSLGNVSAYNETELLLRFTVAAHVVTGYEVTLNVQPTQNYIQVNRWNGLSGGSSSNYTQIANTTGVVHNGDLVRATMVGSTIRVYVNGTQVLTVTDATYATGNPGMGFFDFDNGGHADPSLYGFTRYTAHTIGTPWPLNATQSQALTLGQSVAMARVMTIGQVQLPALIRRVQLAGVATQGQAVSLTIRKVFVRTVSTTQAQVALTPRPTALTVSASQAQSVTLARRFGLSRTVTQAETLALALIAGHTYPLTRVAMEAQGLHLTYSVLVLPGPVGISVFTRPPNSGSAVSNYPDWPGLIIEPSIGGP
jgi:hypothetical protein